MNKRVLAPGFVFGIVAVLALVWVGGVSRAIQHQAEETDLNSSGTAYEINPDGAGNLWISDFGGDEIRRLNPETGAYTAYQDLSAPSDARSDGAGNVWWSDAGNQLRRLTLASGLVTTWALPDGSMPVGTAVDQAGNVWVTDASDPLLHRFDPGTTELCSYAVPDGGSSNYIVADGADIWLSDYANARILRLEPSSDRFTLWDLPWSSYINGLAIDADSELWVAESGAHSLLARLDPQIDQLTTYTLPVGVWPEMLTLHAGLVWYSEDYDGTVGVLDPATASGGTETLSVSSTGVTSNCSTLGAGSSATAAASSGTATWVTTVLTNVVDSGGWTVYSLPAGSTPWGITVLNEQVFVVDQGRQTLVRITEAQETDYQVFLPIVQR